MTSRISFATTLRPYQLRALGWLQFLARLGLGGCLADDMGLGKTPTTLAHLGGRPGPHLVVCPLSVVRNWQAEARNGSRPGCGRWCITEPTGSAAPTSVAPRSAPIWWSRPTGWWHATSRELRAIDWSTLVLDEAQAVRTRAARRLRPFARFRGPEARIDRNAREGNRLDELWAILDAWVNRPARNRAIAAENWAVPIERHQDAGGRRSLRRITAPCVLRRTKADRSLVPDLPDKVEADRLGHAHQGAGRDVPGGRGRAAEGGRSRSRHAAARHRTGGADRLKQICNHPAHARGQFLASPGGPSKLARFDELVADFDDSGERALVFTQYREMGLLLQRHLAELSGRSVPFLHGGVHPKAGRDRMVEFQDGTGPPLLLVSLRAGGTGLNLTAASRVVHYDRWWNPAVEDQATDRQRLGQRQAVFVHKLVCQGNPRGTHRPGDRREAQAHRRTRRRNGRGG
ncbi:MAG: DEAD/DEAH box helicase [Ilumatobacteraceae bacterium]